MSADFSGAIASVQAALPADRMSVMGEVHTVSATSWKDKSSGFSDLVSQGLEQVNQQLLTSQSDLQSLAVGNAQNLHQIMIRLEESKLSFQLMMQVRSRLLEAYQDVIKMQL